MLAVTTLSDFQFDLHVHFCMLLMHSIALSLLIMAQKLSAELGLGVGISSGANFLGAVKILDEIGEDKVVVTVFPDSNKKYLSTDLMKKQEVKVGYVSTDIELQRFKAVR